MDYRILRSIFLATAVTAACSQVVVPHAGDASSSDVSDVDSHRTDTARDTTDALLQSDAMDGADGVVHGDAGLPDTPARPDVTSTDSGLSPYTVDRMDMAGFLETYEVVTGMNVMSAGRNYYLNNGTEWPSGAGSAQYGRMRLERVERVGALVRYHMTPDALLLRRTDYDGGDHSVNFRLDSEGELVLEATLGSSSGVVHGRARVAVDEPASYADMRFNHLSAPLDSVVSFTATYTLRSAAFTETLFASAFDYSSSVTVDLTTHMP